LFQPIRTRTRLALVATCATLLVSACGSSSKQHAGVAANAPKGPTINVGVISSLSGTPAPTPEIPQVAQAWASYVNGQGGINGHPVHVVVLDDGQNSAKALAAVESAVQEQHVVAIISMGVLEQAWASYVEQQKVPAIGGEEFSETWIQNPMFFPTSTTLDSVIYSIVDSAKVLGASSFGDMYDPAVPSASGAVNYYKQTAQALGLTWTGGFSASTNAPNYTAPCVAAEGAKTEALELAYAPSPIATIANDCATQGYHPIYLIADGTWSQAMASVPGLKNSGGPVYGFPWFYQGPQTAGFHAAISKFAPGIKMDDYISTTWLALAAFQKAAASIPAGATPTSSDILNGLWSFNNETLGGLSANPLTFTQGSHQKENSCWYVIQIKNGSFATPNELHPTCQA
jgi:branched-chain amino acid transport system substrate-binding protein